VSASQRRKGAAGEREAAELCRQLWPQADRNPMQARGAKRDGCEVEGTPHWIEVKSGVRPPIMPALRQAKRDIAASGDARAPVVMAKTTRQGWTVTMDWSTFATLVREGQAARAAAVQMAQPALIPRPGTPEFQRWVAEQDPEEAA
jgi:hypothetical protein